MPRTPHPARTPRDLRTALALACTLCAAAHAAPRQSEESPIIRRVLVTSGLQQRLVNIVSMSEQELVARDASTGAPVRVPLSNVRALLPVMLPLGGVSAAGARRSDAPSLRRVFLDEPAVAVTTDAQSLPGKPGAGEEVTSPDSLPWRSSSLGSVTLPLDSLQRLLNRQNTPARAPGTADRVFLRNADVIDGFVELVPATQGPSISLSVDTGNGHTSTLDWATIDSVEFAASPQPSRGAWAWLSDSTAVAVTALAVTPQGQMTLSWAHGTLAEPTPATNLWAYAPSREHIDALAARPLVGATPGDHRTYAQPPRDADSTMAPLGAADIEISGPITAAWDLGPGALRIAGSVEMAPADRIWGDCVVTLEAVAAGSDAALTAPAKELWSARINADKPTATLAADLPDPAGAPLLLRVRITDGANGPVQDRVWLRRVLIER